MTLEKADGSSIGVDIPLPESVPRILNVESAIETAIVLMSPINFLRNTHTTDNLCINLSKCTVSGYGYIAGPYYNSILTNPSYSMCTVGISSNQGYWNGAVHEDLTIELTQTSFNVPIEDGNYKMPIDYLCNNSGQGLICRRVLYKDTSENEEIFFTVDNGTATITLHPMELDKSHFVCQYFALGSGTVTGFRIILDRIIQIN